MARTANWKAAALLSVALPITNACGGPGGGVASAPLPLVTPSPSPTPTPSATAPLSSPVTILRDPATQEFATYEMGAPLRIQFEADTKTYEVSTTDGLWERLSDDPQAPPGRFLIGDASGSTSWLNASSYESADPNERYEYSSLADWAVDVGGPAAKGGWVVFGMPTPASGVPTSGTALYAGQIRGVGTFPAKGGWGDFDHAPIGGTASMTMNFASGSFTGSMMPLVTCDCDVIALPRMDFQGTLTPSSSTFGGHFITDAAGPNSLAGMFTGPSAQESIGQWTFPLTIAGTSESMSGLWISRR